MSAAADDEGKAALAGGDMLDVRGLQCPLPVLRANKAMRTLAIGDTLTVLATDAAAPGDFANFCASAGHELVENTERDGVYTLAVRKGR